MSDTPQKERYCILDAYRGLCVLVMIIYHAAFDLAVNGFLPVTLLINPVMEVIHPIFAGSFVLMSGATCRFSRSNLKKAIILALCAATVSAVTYLFARDMFVSFGILHFLAACALIYHILGRLFEKYENIAAPLCLALFLASYFIFPVTIETPGLAFAGFPTIAYESGDYYPLLPWIFLFFFGAFVGGVIKNNRMPPFFYRFRFPLFEKIGRFSLIIYLVHQPLIYGAVTFFSSAK
ncbi:MAG: DUF1624 domain-containing protein [Clostridia bacterium]|nr:DUF1624 domain-containing protein [Clostridia bacterium]